MTYILPIPLPEMLVAEREVVPKNDFTHKHYTVGFAPDGRGYVHSDMFYNYFRYKQGDRDLSATIVTLLDKRFSITGQAFLEDLHHDLTHDGDSYIFNNSIQPLAVTGGGEIVFTTQTNRTFVLDGELERVAHHDAFSDVIPVPGGMVTVRSRQDIGVAETTVVQHTPRIIGSVETLVGAGGYRGYLGRFEALDLDRILVAQFEHRGRSGWIDAGAFAFTVIDGQGKVVRKLPLGAADTPYSKPNTYDDSHVAHRPLRVWITRSEAALHVFDRDGERLLRIGLAPFEAVVPLTLLAVGPAGELVMVSKKHHLLVVSDPIESVSTIETALADINAVYASELARLKKVVAYQNGRWFGWESQTTRAMASVPKQKKAKAKPVAEVPPQAAPTTPGEAIALAPDDVDAISVYADSLADTVLGEYINTSVRAHRTPKDDPERAAFEERAASLFREHGEKWMRTWNAPVKICEPKRFDSFCGMPRSIVFDETVPDLAALDRQVAQLPIQLLGLTNLTTKDLHSLGSLAVLRRIHHLFLSASSKRKLAKPALAWLAGLALTNLRRLGLYSVSVTGPGLREVIASMPRLTELTSTFGGLSAEGVDDIAAVAPKLEKLSINYNPLGSAIAPKLGQFSALKTLELNSVDFGDDITAEPPRLPVTKLEIDDNPRLGAKGLAWLVAAMPDVRELKLPRQAAPSAIDELVPWLPQLESIDVSWMDEPSVQRLVELLPQTRVLRRLCMLGSQPGLARAIVEHTAVKELQLGNVEGPDLAALADAKTVKELVLCDGTDDTNIRAITRIAMPALETLHVHSRTFSEGGIAAVLAAPWPRFKRLELMYAQIRDAGVVSTTRPIVLRLFKCEVPRGQLEALRRDWGDRLMV